MSISKSSVDLSPENPCGCYRISSFVFSEGDCKTCWDYLFNPLPHQVWPGRTIELPSPLTISASALPANGPGTKLRELWQGLGITDFEQRCGCAATAATMDRRGVEWCLDNIQTLIDEIRANAKGYGWRRVLKSIISKGTAFHKELWYTARRLSFAAVSISPVNGIIGEAIRIACERAAGPEPRPPTPLVSTLPVPQVLHLKKWRIDSTKLASSKEAHFNSSVIEWRGRILMAYRRHWYQSKVHICELNWATGQPINDTYIKIPKTRDNEMAVEDPRLFIFNGELWLSVAALARGKERPHTNAQIVKLDPVTLQPVESYFPEYHPRREWEKNWSFFEYKKELHAIYTTAPNHIVIKADHEHHYQAISRLPFDWPAELGHPRGGASPILWRNEWYNFVHCVMEFNKRRWYSINLYTFENKPPFRPSRILPFPMLLPSEDDRWNDTHPNAIFPSGVMIKDYAWNISYGYQDRWCEMASWDIGWLDRFLEPIPGGVYDRSFEPGWHDKTVWRDVYVANDYELPDAFKVTDTIVDVGGHVGSFSTACLDRGAGLVVSCEPEFVKHLEKNLSRYGERARIVPRAIGSPNSCSCIQPYDGKYYGAKRTEAHFGECLPLQKVLDGLGPVRLLKLDCEGPEYSIVEETDLSQVQEIIGEVHPYQYNNETFPFERFREAVERQGFAFTKAVRPGETWLFWASR